MAAYYNENDPYCVAWLRALIAEGLIADGEVDERSIVDVRAAELAGFTQCHFFAGIGGWSYALRLAGWSDDRPVWTGSCPCQPWSVAGKGDGANDPRDLWPAWFRLIDVCGPGVVFGEQVESPAGRAWFDRVSVWMEGISYAVGAIDLSAASVDAPQNRLRLWFVADANHPRRKGPIRQRQPRQTLEEWSPARREPVRPDCGSWPPGPRAVHHVPVLVNGVPGVVGGCKGYGNAIVPQVAALFIQAYDEVTGNGSELTQPQPDDESQLGDR